MHHRRRNTGRAMNYRRRNPGEGMGRISSIAINAVFVIVGAVGRSFSLKWCWVRTTLA